MYVYKNKLAFIAHPRVASRSVSSALTGFGAAQVGTHHGVDNQLIGDILPDGIVACVTRNMFDVLVSWFHRSRRGQSFKVTPYQEFDEWLKIILEGGHEFLDKDPYHFGYETSNFVIPYDALDDMFPFLCRVVGIEPPRLARIGASLRVKDYRRYYTAESIRLVEHRWGPEQHRLGYSF